MPMSRVPVSLHTPFKVQAEGWLRLPAERLLLGTEDPIYTGTSSYLIYAHPAVTRSVRPPRLTCPNCLITTFTKLVPTY